MLAPSAFLASATCTSDLQNKILRSGSVASPLRHFRQALKYGQHHQQEATKQRNWDSGIIMAALTSLTSKVTAAISRIYHIRFLAAQSAHAGDCMAPGFILDRFWVGNWHFPPPDNFSFLPDNFKENKKLCVVV